MRRCDNSALQGARIEPLLAYHIKAFTQIAADMLHVEFRMELQPPGARRETDRVTVVERRARQHHRATRWLQNTLQMRRMRAEAQRRALQQRIVARGRQAFDIDRADLATARVVVDLAAEGMR